MPRCSNYSVAGMTYSHYSSKRDLHIANLKNIREMYVLLREYGATCILQLTRYNIANVKVTSIIFV